MRPINAEKTYLEDTIGRPVITKACTLLQNRHLTIVDRDI